MSDTSEPWLPVPPPEEGDLDVVDRRPKPRVSVPAMKYEVIYVQPDASPRRDSLHSNLGKALARADELRDEAKTKRWRMVVGVGDLDNPERGWLQDDEACHRCGNEWPETMQACPSCGITIEDVAQSLANDRQGEGQ